MSQDELDARNLRFSGRHSCILTRTPVGTLALFEWGGTGNLLYCGDDWQALAEAFLARPEWSYRPAERPPRVVKVAGIDLSDLEIDL